MSMFGDDNPLTCADNLTEKIGGKNYLKREDLNHAGAHKINNVIGQISLAKRMGVSLITGETGAGEHGLVTATACAMFGMPCRIFIGKPDTERQALNVFRMELLGCGRYCGKKGQGYLKDAVDEALGDLVKNFENTFYLLGSTVGPHPYPSVLLHTISTKKISGAGRSPYVQKASVLSFTDLNELIDENGES